MALGFVGDRMNRVGLAVVLVVLIVICTVAAPEAEAMGIYPQRDCDPMGQLPSDGPVGWVTSCVLRHLLP